MRWVSVGWLADRRYCRSQWSATRRPGLVTVCETVARWCSPSSLLNDLGRVLRVRAKPLRGCFASLDTSVTATGSSYEKDGRGPGNSRSGNGSANGFANETVRDGGDATADQRQRPVPLPWSVRRSGMAETRKTCVVLLITQRRLWACSQFWSHSPGSLSRKAGRRLSFGLRRKI